METQGARYEATKGLSVKEVAGLIRRDIRAAVASGALPPGTYSVWTRNGVTPAIDIRASGMPFRVLRPPGSSTCRTPEATAVASTLREIAGAYNRDRSQPNEDYWDLRFFLYVEIDAGTEIEDDETAPTAPHGAEGSAAPCRAAAPTLRLVSGGG